MVLIDISDQVMTYHGQLACEDNAAVTLLGYFRHIGGHLFSGKIPSLLVESFSETHYITTLSLVNFQQIYYAGV